MRKISKMVKKFDIFGSAVHLKINKQETSKTSFGGFLTFIDTFSLFFMLITYISDLLEHKNPNVTSEIKKVKNPSLNVNTSNLPISFYISFENGSAIEMQKYFSVNTYYNYYNTKNSIYEKNITEVIKCTNKDFPLVLGTIFEKFPLLCLKNWNINIGGGWDQDYIRYFEINVQTCKNSSENGDNCLSQDAIADVTNNNLLLFNIFLGNEAINTYSFNNFTTSELFNLYSYLSVKDTKILRVYIQNYRLETDDGLLFSSFRTHDSVTFDIVEIDSRSKLGDDIFRMTLLPSKNMLIYHRYYNKLPSLLASIGGLSKIMQIFFYIISTPFSIIKRNENIFNKILNYDSIEIESKEAQGKPKIQFNKEGDYKCNNSSVFEKNSSILHIPVKSDNSRSSRIMNRNKHENHNYIFQTEDRLIRMKNTNRLEKNLDLNTIKEYQINLEALKEKNTLKLKYCEIIEHLFLYRCRSKIVKNKFNLYYQSLTILDWALDLSRIIEKLEEFEKLKLVILSSEQIALFNFMSKDTISLNMNKTSNLKIRQLKHFGTDKDILLKVILDFQKKIISGDPKISPLDRKLFSLLADEVKFFT
jgi:hypothetical protein